MRGGIPTKVYENFWEEAIQNVRTMNKGDHHVRGIKTFVKIPKSHYRCLRSVKEEVKEVKEKFKFEVSDNITCRSFEELSLF